MTLWSNINIWQCQEATSMYDTMNSHQCMTLWGQSNVWHCKEATSRNDTTKSCQCMTLWGYIKVRHDGEVHQGMILWYHTNVWHCEVTLRYDTVGKLYQSTILQGHIQIRHCEDAATSRLGTMRKLYEATSRDVTLNREHVPMVLCGHIKVHPGMILWRPQQSMTLSVHSKVWYCDITICWILQFQVSGSPKWQSTEHMTLLHKKQITDIKFCLISSLTQKTPNGILDRLIKKVNQKANLWRCPMPDAHPMPACPDTTTLKDGFLKNLSKNGSFGHSFGWLYSRT